RLRDEVLAVVAHDLRNPLSRISTTAALLADASLPSESRQQLLGVLQRSAGAMDRLVRDLLDVASIEAGRLAVERRPLDVAALVADVCALFGPAAAERGVRLDCQATEDTPAVAADHDRLLQALGNLLDNALRLTPAGGRIVVRAGGVGEAARLSVSDTGPGIGPEELPHLFDRFWQDLRSRRGSAGLGLAIAKGIVEAHEGRLWAESTPGQGSTFVILLPGRPASAGTSGE
ncbi:MAG TPA: HAMP domain-containing sensor histidine kinase, partial [Gemmatimonadaceae bacterium]|nr:HAMP domain-containing sensor histidine kinase [Gemmatimonadaceae bacterium]